MTLLPPLNKLGPKFLVPRSPAGPTRAYSLSYNHLKFTPFLAPPAAAAATAAATAALPRAPAAVVVFIVEVAGLPLTPPLPGAKSEPLCLRWIALWNSGLPDGEKEVVVLERLVLRLNGGCVCGAVGLGENPKVCREVERGEAE